MDATSSFQHVVDSHSEWKSQLAALTVHAASKYDEYISEYKKVMHQVKQKRQKSDSIASIHSDTDTPAEDLKSPQLSDFIAIDPMEAGNRFIYAQAQKKRRAGTSLRSNASGVRNVRSRKMVIIYYDSYIQAELDKLVRAFGAARNNLRKGRNAYTASKGFPLPTLNRRYDMTNRTVSTAVGSKIQGNKAQSDVVVLPESPSIEQSFTNTDKEIEAIQSLCESAAHQAIRDGDCSVELNQALVKLDALLVTVIPVLEHIKAEKTSLSLVDRQNEVTKASANVTTQSKLFEKNSIEGITRLISQDMASSNLPKKPSLPTTPSAHQPLAMDAIEVDDDEDDDGSSLDLPLNFANYRNANRRVAT